MAGGYKAPKVETVQHAGRNVPVGVMHVKDGHGAKHIQGTRGQEIDFIGGDEVKKGLDVHSTHRIPELAHHDGAQETKPNPVGG